jgi:hypothetical protein
MKKKTKHTLLKGEGIHQHTLYGDFKVKEQENFSPLVVTKDSDLIHEKPDGSTGEHKTLKIEQGEWVMGQQVEFNPFDQKVTRVWD